MIARVFQDSESTQRMRLWERSQGRELQTRLRPGDGIAILLENDPRYFEIIWAARRLGLYFTPVAKHLKPAEAVYIIRDCGANVVFLAGTVPKVDVVKAQVDVSQAENDLIANDRTLITARASLNRLLGRTGGAPRLGPQLRIRYQADC